MGDARDRFLSIQERVGTAQVAIGQTLDPVPQWLQALKTVGMIVLIAGVVFVLIKFSPILSPLFRLVGSMIPNPSVDGQAKLDAERASEGLLRADDQQRIFHLRATSPRYNRTFRRIKNTATQETSK